MKSERSGKCYSLTVTKLCEKMATIITNQIAGTVWVRVIFTIDDFQDGKIVC